MKNPTLALKTSILFLFTLLCAAIASLQSADAATITVQSTGDGAATPANCPGAGCRLRDALAAVNDGDTIDFGVAVTGTITLPSGELLVNDSITISGPGSNTLAVNGNAAHRVFHIASGKTVTIDGLTIMNGHGGDGGGIYNDHATLTVSNCTIAGNSADRGAGIHNNGHSGGSATLTVLNSTISGNSTNLFGGAGIFNDGYGSGNATLLVIASTINNNTALEVGGGIRSEGGTHGSATVSVRNSTISGNSATGATHCCDAFGGGGIQNDGKNGGSASLEILNSTFSGNAANLGGGGIYNDARHGGSGTVTLGDTIFKAGSLGENIHNDSGTVTSLGYNLSSDNASAFLNATGDQNSTNPLLGPLQDNGGPTFTHELLPGSPAIDKGINFSGSTTDQRGPGFARTFDDPSISNATGGDGTDIGAFEVQTPSCEFATSIRSNFNAFPIDAGNYIWFTSVLKPSGLVSTPVTITFTQQTIASANFTLPVPDASVTFDPNANFATTTFSGGMWVTTVPSSGLAGNTLFSALGYQVPANLPGGMHNVTWSGTISTDTPGVSVQWKWAAAVYTNFNADYNLLGVKPVDGNKKNPYLNGDHAGTPENFKTFVIGGATGGGGSNYTGGLSGTGSVGPCQP